MVEEVTSSVNRTKTKTKRPRPVYLWSVADVRNWFQRFCPEYYPLYWNLFQQHDITGRSLIRINENSLRRLGVEDVQHRQYIWREIIKIRLKTDIIEIRDLERRANMHCD